MYKAKQRPQPFLYKISCICMYITFFPISYFKDKTLYTFLTVKAQLEHEHNMNMTNAKHSLQRFYYEISLLLILLIFELKHIYRC